MASVQEQRRGILLLAFASAVLRIYMPGTVVYDTFLRPPTPATFHPLHMIYSTDNGKRVETDIMARQVS
jgi:hypothetical protein